MFIKQNDINPEHAQLKGGFVVPHDGEPLQYRYDPDEGQFHSVRSFKIGYGQPGQSIPWRMVLPLEKDLAKTAIGQVYIRTSYLVRPEGDAQAVELWCWTLEKDPSKISAYAEHMLKGDVFTVSDDDLKLLEELDADEEDRTSEDV